jgi:hypothetical protein
MFEATHQPFGGGRGHIDLATETAAWGHPNSLCPSVAYWGVPSMDTALGSLDKVAIVGWLVLSAGPAMFRRDGHRRCKGYVGCRGGVVRSACFAGQTGLLLAARTLCRCV